MKPSSRFFLFSLFALFFFSGFAGLIYESIWSHYLKLFVGHAAYAQTLVLAIYMGGMALGSWLASHYTTRIKNLLIGYAAAEMIIGLTALLFHQFFVNYLSLSYDTVFPALGSAFAISLYKWATAPLLILPQTVLLGATFPLMASGIIRLYNDAPGRTISVLYFVNSLGGAVGVLFGGFYCIEKFALPGTVQFAGIIDLFVGAGVIVLWLLKKDRRTVKNKAEKTKPLVREGRPIDSTAWTMLFVAGGTAASSFIYEVGWIRMLSLVLGSSTHSFELMLSAFILGLAVGGFWIKNRLDSMKNPMTALAKIQVAMGVCAIATTVFYGKLFYLMKFLMSSMDRTEQGFLMFHVYSHLICLLVMLPATILAGMTLPIITWYLYKRDSDESIIGRVYAFNTVGSIFGVFIAIQALMPFIGLKFLLIVGGAMDMLIGIFLAQRFREQSSRRLLPALAGITLIAIAIPSVFVHFNPVLLASGVYRNGKINNSGQMVYYKDGKTSSVSLIKRAGRYLLATNGKTDASISIDTAAAPIDVHTQILLGAYPLFYSRKCQNVGVIGLGSGMTASMLLESDALQQLDVVEIEPCILEAARLMGPIVRNVFTDKRSKIQIDDAKTFFSAHQKKYDIIVSEPSNPWVSGVAGLFSVEFFRLIAKHLTAAGMLVQWFHLYEMSPELVASIVKSIDRIFPDYKAFVCGPDMILLASNSPIRNSPSKEPLKNPNIAALLRKISIEHDYDLQSNYIGGKRSLSYLTGMFTVPLNSDFNSLLDLKAIKARILNLTADEYAKMSRFIIPVRKIIENDTTASLHQAIGRKIPANDLSTFNINADYEAWQAWLYLSCLGTHRQPFTDSVVSPTTALTVAEIRMTARDNSIAARRIWPDYAMELLKITMPYLPAKQMKEIWAFIDEEGKNLAIKQESRDMLAVLKNITFGEFENAYALCSNLIKSGQIADDEYYGMLTAAYLIASIKLNKFVGIQELWGKIGAMNYDYNLIMLYFYIYNLVESPESSANK